jgi:hypothetical protein
MYLTSTSRVPGRYRCGGYRGEGWCRCTRGSDPDSRQDRLGGLIQGRGHRPCAPQDGSGWAEFLRSQALAILALDFAADEVTDFWHLQACWPERTGLNLD